MDTSIIFSQNNNLSQSWKNYRHQNLNIPLDDSDKQRPKFARTNRFAYPYSPLLNSYQTDILLVFTWISWSFFQFQTKTTSQFKITIKVFYYSHSDFMFSINYMCSNKEQRGFPLTVSFSYQNRSSFNFTIYHTF